MSDVPPVVHIGENLPEYIAFELMHIIALAEGKNLSVGTPVNADREWILDTYAECLGAVRGNRIEYEE